MTDGNVTYQELDSTTRLNMVRARLREVEQQHFSLALRVKAPDLSVPPSEQDVANLSRLETSLSNLRQMEQELTTPTTQTPEAASTGEAAPVA